MPFTAGVNEEVTNLFAHVAYQPNFYSRNSNARPPLYGDEVTWVAITMRPETGAPITSWDYVNAYYQHPYQMISNCLLEASVDGNQWTRLAEVTNDTKPTRDTWQSNTSAYQVGYTTHTTGMPIPPGPTNDVAFAASSVSVAAGAELVARAPEKPVIRVLAVDGTAGGGRIDGFAFAEECTLDIVNPPAGTAYAIPMTFANCDGLETANWSVSVGGHAKASLRASVTATGFEVRPIGTWFIIR